MRMKQLTEADIRALASERSYERGESYFRGGAVEDVARRGNVVTAEVAGSGYEPYAVQLVLGDAGVQSSSCSCPYDWGGWCKHLVAVGLTLVHQAEEVVLKPELATLLADLSEGQLRQLILNVAAEDTAVIEAIEGEIGWLKQSTSTTPLAIDINGVRRAVRKTFRAETASGGGHYDGFEYDEGLEIYGDNIYGSHLARVDLLLDRGEADTAVAVITAVLEEWVEGINELDEWVYEYNQDALSEDADTLGAVLTEVLLSLELSADERAEWKKRIGYWESQLGDMGMAETAVEQGWAYPPLLAVLQGNITEWGAWEEESPYFADDLARVRLHILKRQERVQAYLYLAKAEGLFDLYVNMLANDDQFDQAVAEARKLLDRPTAIHRLAEILLEKGQVEQALAIAEYGLDTPPTEYDHGKAELGQWVCQQAEVADEPVLALKGAKIAFMSQHELGDYQAAQQLAGAEWPAVKEELLQSLKKAWESKRIDVYLYEGMLVEAMLVVDKEDRNDLSRVLEATQETYPDWSIQKCKNRAEAIMDAGQAKYYDTAVSWVQRARDIYGQHDRQSEWYAYLDSLLSKHARKYKLVPMLRNIR